MRPLGVKDCGFPVSKVRFHPTKAFFLCGSATDNSLLAFTWDEEGKLSQPISLTAERTSHGIFDLAFHPSEDVVAGGREGNPPVNAARPSVLIDKETRVSHVVLLELPGIPESMRRLPRFLR